MKKVTLEFETKRGHIVSVEVPGHLDPSEFWVENGFIYHEAVWENGFMVIASRPALRWVEDFSEYKIIKEEVL